MGDKGYEITGGVKTLCSMSILYSNMNQYVVCDKQLRSTIILIKTTMKGDAICHHLTDLDTDLCALLLSDCSIVYFPLWIRDDVVEPGG